MKRWAVLLALVLVPSAASAQTNMVSIGIVDDPRPQDKWGYAPASRRVTPGTWITWSNNGIDAHSVTGATFDSGILNPSEGFSWYFDQDGTYEYVCTLHTWMTGKIVVGSGVAADPEPTPEPEPEDVIEE